MKRTMVISELPTIDDPRKPTTASVMIRGPGIVRQTNVMAKPTMISVVLQATGREPIMDLVPVIIFEVDPDAREKHRRFIIIPPGMTVSVEEPATLEYRGSFLYPQGSIFFLFEEISPWVHPDYKPGSRSYCRRCGKGIRFWEAADEGPCSCTERQIEDFTKEAPPADNLGER